MSVLSNLSSSGSSSLLSLGGGGGGGDVTMSGSGPGAPGGSGGGGGGSTKSMSRDINDSIRIVLGKGIKILVRVPVKLEIGKSGEKTENRILVLSAHRIFIMLAKVPTRIDHHFHYLDIKRLDGGKKSGTSISFTCANPPSEKIVHYSFRSESVDLILGTLASALRSIFPGVAVENVIGRLDLSPQLWTVYNAAVAPLHSSSTHASSSSTHNSRSSTGPCGGFSAQYACMCDYYGLPFREEVAWDVDTIYFSHDSREMCLQDFEHLDHRDLVCIISALEHNTWFTKLRASSNSPKLPADICDRVLGVVSKSCALAEVHMSSIGARWEFAHKLSAAMMTNPRCALVSFDLSCNFLEDKGIAQISQAVAKLAKGLHHVNLSHCSLTSKGITNFSHSLVANRNCASTLTYLNLCGNSMKEVESSHALCSFLAQPNVVAILDISSTETPLDILFNALVRGCTTSLTHLNLSRNPFSSKKAKDIPAAFKQFFAGTLSLQYVNLSHCKLPAEALKNLLLGLACNEATANVELNLSNNNLGSNGAAVLESCIGGVVCLSRLDLSENNIEAEMAGVMNGIAKNKSILSLNVSRNMTGIKAKHLSSVMESIVQLLQDEEASLTKLNLSDCKLKTEINNVINALGSNQCLQHLDIQGNGMGDVGARLLAKALQINTRLRIINLDRNGISLQGYTDITYALQSNYAMRHIPFPTYDMQHFIKTHPERVDVILHRLQELLQRNSSPHQFKNTAQAFRLTQGFILSSTQQILDRVSAQTQDSVESMKKVLNDNEGGAEEIKSSLKHAKGLIHDAENSKHLLSALHEVTTNRNEIDTKMKSVSNDLSRFMMEYVEKNMENMLICAEKQCPETLSAGDSIIKSEIRSVCQKKCVLPNDFVSNLISDHVGLEIHNKINELNLIIANNISDRVIDHVIESMSNVSKNIAVEMGSYKKKRSLTPDVLKQGRPPSTDSTDVISSSNTHFGNSSGSTPGSAGDATSQKSESSPLNTPQISKRKSLHDRKLRPKSIADESDHKPPPPDLLTHNTSNNSTIQEEDSVPELPSVSALQHLGKARPKRPKKHAPSRGAIISTGDEASSNDSGLENFFSSSANIVSVASPTGSTQSGSPMLEEVPRHGGSFSSISSSSLIKDPIDTCHSEKSPMHQHKTTTPTHSKLSCLVGQDDESPLPQTPKSPDKKSGLSPSVHSISDIFGKSKKKEDLKSPIASPKILGDSTTDPPIRRRKSSLLDEDHSEFKKASGSPTPTVTAADYDAGKRTPEEVVRRVGVSLGGNMLAEMKAKQEKRSSVVGGPTPIANNPVKSAKSLDSSVIQSTPSTSDKDNKSSPSPSNSSLFGKVKLRSTGLAGSLTSPTNEFATTENSSSTTNKTESKTSTISSTTPSLSATTSTPTSGGGGSIVGLRASKFSGGGSHDKGSPPLVESLGPKPKPLPKPRPWSIVGVDRKSGEITSVVSDNNEESTNKKSSLEKPSSTTVSAPKKSSVRDLINNMNKNESSGGVSESSRRKGNSLPRTVPPSSSSDTPPSNTKETPLGRSPKFAHSPTVAKKESTSDDPRILKLDDDFAFDDVMDV